VPGFEPHTGPKSFADKYGTGLTGDHDQIAVSMLDYIRQTTMNDGNLPWNCQFSIICPGNPAEGYGQITPLSTIGGPKWRPGQPLADGDRCGARGFRRVMTISEVALIFTCRAQAVRAGDTVKIIGKPSAENRSRLIEPGDREIEAGILVEGFVPAQGWTDYRPYCSIALGGTPPAGSPALSTPCTTAGKINLNHPLVPFSNLRRATGIHALLKAERIMAIPDTASAEYKDTQHFSTERWRHHIDDGATLRTIDADVFSKGRVFLSATELCKHYLVPEGQEGTRAAMSAFWSRHRLTGDNTRERPYANLIGRLTTRSNVYRVHFIAQSIRQPAAPDRAGFDAARDTISGEFAGDAVVERFIDPADPDLPDYAAEIAAGGTPPPLDSFYSWRITAFKQLTR